MLVYVYLIFGKIYIKIDYFENFFLMLFKFFYKNFLIKIFVLKFAYFNKMNILNLELCIKYIALKIKREKNFSYILKKSKIS
jgi:hypothetical protein